MNFSFVDEFVAGSAGPLTKTEVNWLKEKKGIQAILSVRKGPLAKLWVEGLEYLNVSVKNHAVPTLAELKTCVDYIMKQVNARKKCDVHCAAGRGRTGTVLACYFCRRYGLSAIDAIAKIRQMRPGSIEKQQEKSVFEYVAQIKTGQSQNELPASDPSQSTNQPDQFNIS
jgi:atypical dual specificity phosphatase